LSLGSTRSALLQMTLHVGDVAATPWGCRLLNSLLPVVFFLGGVLGPALARGGNCRVTGGEAVAVAKQAGFSFATSRLSGEGSCFLKKNGAVVIASAADEGPDIECQVKFFGDRILSGQWRMAEALFTGAQFRFDVEPQWNSATAELTLVLAAPKGGVASLRLHMVTLTGPDCDDWKRAFTAPTGRIPSAPAGSKPARKLAHVAAQDSGDPP
jgi:hypothetical protein